MLKFFRRIRRKLLDEGGMRKYLIYAIGEIALVVIGILIALQINSWNQDKEDRKLEVEYLLRIKQEMQTNYNMLLELVEYSEFQSENVNLINQIIFEDSLLTDFEPFFIAVHHTGYTYRSGYSSNVWNELISNGHVRLIRDLPLRDKLASFHRYMLRNIEMEKEFFTYNLEYQKLIGDLFELNLREEVNKKVHPRGLRYQRRLNQLPDQDELISQLKSLSGIKGILWDIKDSKKVMVYSYKERKKEIKEIINSCEKELNKLGVTIKKKQPIELPLETLRKYIGFYRFEGGNEISIGLQDEKLIAKAGRIGVIEIFPESESLFFEENSTRQFEFHKGNGAITGISLHSVDGQTFIGQKVK